MRRTSCVVVAALWFAAGCGDSSPGEPDAGGNSGPDGAVARDAGAPGVDAAVALENGAECEDDSQCRGGYCVTAQSGRRCARERACPPCHVVDAAGACVAASAGTDPKDDCAADPAGCVQDHCDGSGSCEAPEGTTCGAGTCADGSATVQACDADGACRSSTVVCAPFVCNAAGDACLATCQASADCVPSSYCRGASCVQKAPPGAACENDEGCAAGTCEPAQAGRRCATVTCGSCNVVDESGTACAHAVAGSDPKNECTADFAGCTQESCDGAGSCRVSGGTSCSAPSCSGATLASSTCDANGVCQPRSAQCPGNLACNAQGTDCLGACAGDGDCIATHRCSGGACVARKALGEHCGAPVECQSAICEPSESGSRCAATACATCEVIDSTGTTCVAAVAGTDPKNECTAGSCTADTCNGSRACVTAAATCAPPTCTGSTYSTYRCSTAGTCEETSSSCPNRLACGGVNCKGQCTSDADCAADAFCLSPGSYSCQPRRQVGYSCTRDTQCLSGHCIAQQQGKVCASIASCPPCQVATIDGTACTRATPGTDPKSDCTADAAACTQSVCNSAGTCAAPPGTSCGSGTCTGTTLTLMECDASGVCGAVGARCSSSVSCAGDACASGCSGDSDCASGHFCELSTGACKPPKPDGYPCTSADQCAGGRCVPAQNGSRCTSLPGDCPTCQVIDETGTSCVNALADTDPKSECTADSAACLADVCNGAGACSARAGTSCGATICSDSLTQTTFTCDATGVCTANSGGCGNYRCVGSKCATLCVQSATCAPNSTCWNGRCI